MTPSYYMTPSYDGQEPSRMTVALVHTGKGHRAGSAPVAGDGGQPGLVNSRGRTKCPQ